MEAIEKRVSPRMRQLLGTRSGTLALAACVAVVAVIVLIAFLGQYRDSVKGGTAPTGAIVANGLIPKGTSGDVVIGEQMFKPTTVPMDELKENAMVDSAALAGKVAVHDIYPGQQITAADFAGKADPIRGKLTGDQRALSVPVDTAHGLIGHIRTGDRVDVLAGLNAEVGNTGRGRPVVRTLLQNVLVLATPRDPEEIKQGKTGDVTLRVDDREAAALAYVAENGKVWVALRPPAGSSDERPTTVDLESLLAGSAVVQRGNR